MLKYGATSSCLQLKETIYIKCNSRKPIYIVRRCSKKASYAIIPNFIYKLVLELETGNKTVPIHTAVKQTNQ